MRGLDDELKRPDRDLQHGRAPLDQHRGLDQVALALDAEVDRVHIHRRRPGTMQPEVKQAHARDV